MLEFWKLTVHEYFWYRFQEAPGVCAQFWTHISNYHFIWKSDISVNFLINQKAITTMTTFYIPLLTGFGKTLTFTGLQRWTILDLSFFLSPARSRTRETCKNLQVFLLRGLITYTSTSDGSDQTWWDMLAVVIRRWLLVSPWVTRSPRLARDRWCCWSPVKMQIRRRSGSVMLYI